MKRYKTIGITLLIFVNIFYAASQYPGAVFLMIWPGARPTGLAGSFTATADDASSMYYNPGGLGFLNNSSVTVMHANWLPGLYPDMYYEYLGFSRNLKNQGTIGFNAIYLTTGKTEVIDGSGNPLGEYTTFDVSIGASYGFQVNPKLSTGVSAKFIYSYLVPDWVWRAMPELGIDAGGTGLSWALDAGALYKPLHNLNVGMALLNIGPNISYTSTGEADPLPRMLRLGVRYTPLQNQIVKLSIAPEITKVLVGMFYDESGTKTFAEKLNYELWEAWKSLGIEAQFYDLATVRLGYFEDISGQRGGILVNQGGSEEHIALTDFLFTKDHGSFASKVGLTLGMGFQFKGFQVDVSYDGFIYDFPTQNWKISAGYNF